jgi:hypothetical protein
MQRMQARMQAATASSNAAQQKCSVRDAGGDLGRELVVTTTIDSLLGADVLSEAPIARVLSKHVRDTRCAHCGEAIADSNTVVYCQGCPMVRLRFLCDQFMQLRLHAQHTARTLAHARPFLVRSLFLAPHNNHRRCTAAWDAERWTHTTRQGVLSAAWRGRVCWSGKPSSQSALPASTAAHLAAVVLCL